MTKRTWHMQTWQMYVAQTWQKVRSPTWQKVRSRMKEKKMLGNAIATWPTLLRFHIWRGRRCTKKLPQMEVIHRIQYLFRNGDEILSQISVRLWWKEHVQDDLSTKTSTAPRNDGNSWQISRHPLATCRPVPQTAPHGRRPLHLPLRISGSLGRPWWTIDIFVRWGSLQGSQGFARSHCCETNQSSHRLYSHRVKCHCNL